jgi:hypothetical protein
LSWANMGFLFFLIKKKKKKWSMNCEIDKLLFT